MGGGAEGTTGGSGGARRLTLLAASTYPPAACAARDAHRREAGRGRRGEAGRSGAVAVRGRLALLAVVAVAAGTGLLGIDFGHHWDETERIATAILAVERGELISGWYQYPSAVHDLILLSAAPDVARHSVIPALTGAEPTLPAFRAALQKPEFLLRVR